MNYQGIAGDAACADPAYLQTVEALEVGRSVAQTWRQLRREATVVVSTLERSTPMATPMAFGLRAVTGAVDADYASRESVARASQRPPVSQLLSGRETLKSALGFRRTDTIENGGFFQGMVDALSCFPTIAPEIAARQFASEHGECENIECSAREASIEIIYYYNLRPGVGGFADSDCDGPYIVVNARHPSCEQEITVAHEIGHHVLRHLNQPWRPRFEREGEAGEFAWWLLWLFAPRAPAMMIRELQLSRSECEASIRSLCVTRDLSGISELSQLRASIADEFLQPVWGRV